jgi:GT2 family glycosyltransferase
MADQPSSTPVTAVVVTYQSAATIGGALAALKRCQEARLLDTVIVDNDSSDATREIVEREGCWPRALFTGRNNGFGRGCNIGSAQVTTPYTIFINPDAVVEPDAIRTMVQFLERNPKAGIVGPAIVEGADGRGGELQMTGDRPTPASVVRAVLPLPGRPGALRPIAPGSQPIRTGWVCGAVLMIRTELLRQLGGFDPRFFLYWEEMDLCRRAEAAGFDIWAVGSAVARHVGGASSSDDDACISGCIARHYLQSRYYYMSKHHGLLAASAAEIAELVLLSLRTIVDAARGRGLNRLRTRLQAPLLSMPSRP